MNQPAANLLSLQEHRHLRFENFRGVVRAMSGGTRAHKRIAQNLAKQLDTWHSSHYTSRSDEIRLTGVPMTVHVGDLFTGTTTP